MALKAKNLIKYLKKNPEAYVRFVEDKNFGSECTVSIVDFEYDEERCVFILPNLCQCYPEPD